MSTDDLLESSVGLSGCVCDVFSRINGRNEVGKDIPAAGL